MCTDADIVRCHNQNNSCVLNGHSSICNFSGNYKKPNVGNHHFSNLQLLGVFTIFAVLMVTGVMFSQTAYAERTTTVITWPPFNGTIFYTGGTDYDVPIKGTSPFPATIEVFNGTTSLGSIAADSLGDWSMVKQLAIGNYTITANATKGNDIFPSNVISFSVKLLVVVTPDAPVITDPANTKTYDQSSVLIKGTSPTYAKITIFGGEESLGTTYSDGNGYWQFTYDFKYPGGHYIKATATKGGVTSSYSDYVHITIDIPIPAPIITGPTNGTVYYQSSVPMGGTSLPNAKITIFSGGESLGTTNSGNGGYWQFTYDFKYPGSHDITANATRGGATSSSSSVVSITIDIPIPPPQPKLVITSPKAGATLYESSVTIKGIGPALTDVTVFNDTESFTNIRSDINGDWSITKSFGDGTYSINATSSTDDGHIWSKNVSFTVDTTRLAPPTITSPKNGDVFYEFPATVNGTSHYGGATITVSHINNTSIGTTTSNSDGDWSMPIDDGVYSIMATVAKNGKISLPSNIVSFTVDLPTKPTITSPRGGDIFYQSDVTMAGNSNYGDATIKIFNGTGVFGFTQSGADGKWSITKSFNDGEHSIKATVTTKNGRISSSSDTVSFTVDTTLLTPPSIDSPHDGDTFSQYSVTITGISSSGVATITVYDGNINLGTTSSDADGNWSITKSFNNGEHSITATVTKDGKTSLPSKTVSFTVNVILPPPPPQPANPTITSPSNSTTLYQSSVTITGTSSSGVATITVYDANNTSIGTATSKADGDWSITKSFDDGEHSITATVTKDGKTSSSSDTVSFTVDTTPPANPTITSPISQTYYSSNIIFVGTGSASSLIEIYDGSQYLTSVTSDADGVWTTIRSFDDGTYSIKVKDTKTSLFSSVVPFTISTVFNTVFADINNNTKKDKGESGIADATVTAVNLTDLQTVYKTQTDENGIYKFETNSVGTFLIQVAPVPKDHKPSGDTVSYAYILSETELDSERLLNFSLWPVSSNDTATVKGKVFDDSNDNGLPDVGETGFTGINLFVIDFLTVTLKTIATDTNGDYSITGILPDSVLVQAAPIPEGFLPSSGFSSYSYHMLPNSSVTIVDFPLHGVPAEDRGSITIDVFHDANENGVKDAGELPVKDAIVYTFELLTAVPDVQATDASGMTTHTGLLPDVVLAQINASLLPEGFTKITTSNGGFEYVTVTKGSTHTVQIGLN